MRAAITGHPASRWCSRAEESAADRSWANPTPTAPIRNRTPSRRPTFTRRCSPRSATIRAARRTSPRKAAPCRSPTASRSKHFYNLSGLGFFSGFSAARRFGFSALLPDLEVVQKHLDLRRAAEKEDLEIAQEVDARPVPSGAKSQLSGLESHLVPLPLPEAVDQEAGIVLILVRPDHDHRLRHSPQRLELERDRDRVPRRDRTGIPGTGAFAGKSVGLGSVDSAIHPFAFRKFSGSGVEILREENLRLEEHTS